MDTDEQLESGYGPTTPDGDNLLNDFARGEGHAFAEWGRARGDRVVEDTELALTMVDGGSGSPFGNPTVFGRPLLGAELDTALDRMRIFYGEQPGGPYIIMSAWPTPSLRPTGLSLVGHPPFMIRAAAPLTVPPIAGFEIRPVVDADGAADFEDVFVAGYPVPELQPMQRGSFMPPEALDAKGWHHWVGYLEGRPVATASAFLGPHHQHVEFVSALTDTRGRGIGGAITAAATVVDPTLPAALIASDPGQPVYRRLGYQSLLRYTLWLGRRGERP